MSGVWVVGYNMPGYLPEMEPYAFTSFEDAKRSMIDELDRAGDHHFDVGDSLRESDPAESKRELAYADELSAVMEDLNLTSEGDWGVIIANTSWWITYDADASLEDFEEE